VADDTTALLIYTPPRTAAEKMPHKDRAPEDDSPQKYHTFVFAPRDLDLWPWH